MKWKTAQSHKSEQFYLPLHFLCSLVLTRRKLKTSRHSFQSSEEQETKQHKTTFEFQFTCFSGSKSKVLHLLLKKSKKKKSFKCSFFFSVFTLMLSYPVTPQVQHQRLCDYWLQVNGLNFRIFLFVEYLALCKTAPGADGAPKEAWPWFAWSAVKPANVIRAKLCCFFSSSFFC